jgi:hypothetical protein
MHETASFRAAVRKSAGFVPKCHTSVRPTVPFVPFLGRFVRILGSNVLGISR